MIKVTYVTHAGNDLTPVNSARISMGKESDALDEADIKLINYLAKHQHMTPFEHQFLTVIVECPLYIRSQIHRHRTFSYNEISRRYTDENLRFYVPDVDDIRRQAKSNKQASDGLVEAPAAARMAMMKANNTALNTYNDLIAMGVCREQARASLPQSLMTEFYQSGNLRNWVHFIKLRIDNHAQREIQLVGIEARKIVEGLWPESCKALFQ